MIRGAQIDVALVGAGEFGRSFAAQLRRVPGMALRLVCDTQGGRAEAALRDTGYGAVRRCDGREAVLRAMGDGAVAVVEDHALLRDLPLHAVVEATGVPEAAAAVAEAAIASGYHVGLVTKEAEVVCGPALHRRARAAGVVCTTVEGDQPSLLVGLVRRARALGLPVVAAGKSTESDYVWDEAAGTVTAWGRAAPADYAAAFRGEAERGIAALARATVPDLCEMAIVANQVEGLRPDVPGLHAPVCRTTELARVFRPRDAGGILETAGVVDVFTCLRRPDELSFAGGVFVVVEAPDAETGRVLAGKGIPGTAEGGHLLLHNPVHLLGVEAPLSILEAVRHGRGTGGEAPEQRFDLLLRAGSDMRAGTVLALGARHTIAEAVPFIAAAQAVRAGSPVPYYLAAGRVLARDVAAGAVLGWDDLAPADEGALGRLRREQDQSMGEAA